MLLAKQKELEKALAIHRRQVEDLQRELDEYNNMDPEQKLALYIHEKDAQFNTSFELESFTDQRNGESVVRHDWSQPMHQRRLLQARQLTSLVPDSDLRKQIIDCLFRRS